MILGKTPYHQLEDKIYNVEKQLEILNALPSNTELRAMLSPSGEGHRPVADMWQAMQVSKRVDVNTEGVGKVLVFICHLCQID